MKNATQQALKDFYERFPVLHLKVNYISPGLDDDAIEIGFEIVETGYSFKLEVDE